jgi:hypothetical protein
MTLSNFRGEEHVLLEFGGITRPPFVGEVSPLNEHYNRYGDKDFEFLTVYVREPHPGERYHEHGTWEQTGFSTPASAASRTVLEPGS